MVRRCLFAMVLASTLSALPLSAAVHVDARVSWLAATPDKSAGGVFAGSLRFATEPGPRDFARLEALGVAFFDFGRGPAGSRTVFPARIPFAALDALAVDPALAAVDCAWRPVAVPPLPRSRPQVQADQAWQFPSPAGGTVTGKGVVVCDIDTGVNHLHANFFKLAGTAFDWMDNNHNGLLDFGDTVDLDGDGIADVEETLRHVETTAAAYYGNDPAGYDPEFDLLYVDADNNAGRDFGPPLYGEDDPCYGELLLVPDDADGDGILDPDEQLLGLGESRIRAVWNKDGSVHRRGVDLLTSEGDGWGHGTQVTGIMGGGWAGRHAMTGMAPDMETLHVDYEFADEPPFLLPIEAGTAWAVAEGADVVLIEDGEWVWEYLDGSSNYEIMMNEYAADQGIIFVTPTGNLASGHMHARFGSAGGQTLDVPVGVGTTVVWPTFLWTDPVALGLDITTPNGATVSLPLDGTTVTLPGYAIHSDLSVSPRGTRRLDLRLATLPAGGTPSGQWAFAFSGPATEIHGYFGDDLFGWSSDLRWGVGEETATTATWPATADSSLGVGAYAPDGDGPVHGYSGRGPRLDGVPLVDVVAPGSYVLSTSPDNPHAYRWFSGTSSAGPHVAGAAALLKELFPDLDHARCRQYLRAGAAQDAHTTDPDAAGAGKLRIHDTIAALLSDVAAVPPHPGLVLSAAPNPFNPATTIAFDLPRDGAAAVRVFDVAGREVWHRDLEPGSAGPRRVVWDGRDMSGRGLASGVYFAHVKQGRVVAACKVTLVK
jgi:subtilisin family serine protease